MKRRADRISLNDILDEEDISVVKTSAIYLFGAYLEALGQARDVSHHHYLYHSSEQSTKEAEE